MKSQVVAGCLTIAAALAACPTATAQEERHERPYRPPPSGYGSGQGDMRPRRPKTEKADAADRLPFDEHGSGCWRPPS